MQEGRSKSLTVTRPYVDLLTIAQLANDEPGPPRTLLEDNPIGEIRHSVFDEATA